jgi:hypothetical protein
MKWKLNCLDLEGWTVAEGGFPAVLINTKHFIVMQGGASGQHNLMKSISEVDELWLTLVTANI